MNSLREVIASLEGRMAALESAFINQANENEVLKHRRTVDLSGTSEFQLSLGDLLKQQERGTAENNEAVRKSREEDAAAAASGGDDNAPAPPAPKGRRNLATSEWTCATRTSIASWVEASVGSRRGRSSRRGPRNTRR